jgi:hypothetical protein
MQVDLHSRDGTTIATVNGTDPPSSMIVWGTRVFVLDAEGNYVAQGEDKQAVTLPANRPRPPWGGTDGYGRPRET